MPTSEPASPASPPTRSCRTVFWSASSFEYDRLANAPSAAMSASSLSSARARGGSDARDCQSAAKLVRRSARYVASL
jgi:hypothetical protein